MGKIIQIEVPDWVDENTVDKLRELLIEKISEEIEKDYADIKLYNLYFTLKYPSTRNVELKDELRTIEEIRRKEKERVKW